MNQGDSWTPTTKHATCRPVPDGRMWRARESSDGVVYLQESHISFHQEVRGDAISRLINTALRKSKVLVRF